ncbi:MAG: hypothetical protein SVJ22_04305, partial [Halobacteriota archaeon]|nr:hypothetical protein [Halobacteriota archaeon]
MELFKTTNIPSILKSDFTLLVPSLAIILLGELLIFFGALSSGVIFHAINLNALILLIISLRNDERLLEKKISSTSEEFKLETCQVGEVKKLRKQLIQSIILLLQLRILNVSMPIFFTITMYWYPLIYSPMFISLYLMIKNQNISPRSLGFTTDRLHIYIIPAVL